MRMKHRMLSLVLTVCLVAGLLPTTVFAAAVGGFEVEGGTEGSDYSYANGVLTILTSTELTISTSSQTGDRIVVSSGVTANIVLAGVDILASSDSAIDVPSGATVNITLAEGSTNTLKGGLYGAGIHAPAGSTVTISCAKHAVNCPGTDGECGTLSATGGTCWGQWATWINGGAGIGGKNNETAGTIIIHGGKIYAQGGSVYDSRYSRPAGIGGGAGVFGWGANYNGGNGGTVIINGGYVQAAGSNGNNGIGGGTGAPDGGASGTGGYLQINGGTLANTSFSKGIFVSTGGELTDSTASNSTVAEFTENDDALNITKNGSIVETITAPEGQTLTANPEGGVTLPSDSTVQIGEKEFKLPDGGSFSMDCTVTADVVVIGENTTITGDGVTISLGGTLGIPNGSTVQTGAGPVITLPNGGSVEENGTVSGKSVKVGETTITAPGGGTVSTTSDGTTTAPAGSAIETGIGATLIIGADTLAEVSPDGTVTLSDGGTVTVPNINAVITVPSTGGSLGTDNNGYITLPGGVTVATGNETPILIPEIGGLLDPNTGKVFYAAVPVNPGNTVRYIVEHYKASGSGYTLKETEYLGGTIGDTVTAVPKTYTGYTYNSGAAGSVAQGTLKAIRSEADIVTLKLYYDPSIYTVTFNANGGTTCADVTVTFDQLYPTLPTPTKTGYHFAGWCLNPQANMEDCAHYHVSEETIVTTAADHTLYAHWQSKPLMAVSWGEPITVIYDGEAHPLQFAVTSGAARDDGLWKIEYTEHSAGADHTSAPVFTETAPTDADAYCIYITHPETADHAAYVSGLHCNQIIIEPKPITVTGRVSKVYDGSASISITADDLHLEGVIDGDDVELMVSQDAALTLTSPEAGTSEGVLSGVTLTGSDAANYTVVWAVSGTITAVPSAPSGDDGYTPPTYQPDVEDTQGGDTTVTPRNPERGDTVTIVPKPDEGYEVDDVTVTDRNGNPVEVTENEDGTWSFTQPGGKVTIEVTYKPIETPWENPFIDVDEGDWFYEAVKWAVQNGVTLGTSETTFSPDLGCTRAQVVTFLWRTAGCPEPKSDSSPFTDVVDGAYYFKAVLWAVENGVTAGTSATTFSPDAVCSRAQIVTFLWRNADRPDASTSNSFIDIVSDAYYATAVEWAAENKITVGTNAEGTLFSPNDDCTRAQIVTFLWRAYN